MRNFFALAAASTFCLLLVPCAVAEQVDVEPLVAKLKAVGPKGAGHREAIAAWKTLSQADVDQLTDILAGMKGAGRLSENWFRAVVEAVAQKQLKTNGKLPVAALETFLRDTKQSPRARRLAYELIVGVDEAAEQRLIPGLLNDPSLELRRDAVTLALAKAEALEEAGKKDQAAAAYQTAFRAARSLDQIKSASQKLRELEQPPNIPVHMGFLMDWHLVAPFDNTDMKGFDVAYPPEEKVDLGASYQGKTDKVGWVKHTTSDDFGIVDLNVIFKRPKKGNEYELTKEHKGAIGYAVATFVAEGERDVQLRIGSKNAHKVWLNGKLLTANQVYHAGMQVDQYLAEGRLRSGKNEILIKVCQNEQSDSWAQDWGFQLRVCDHLGTAVLSADRTLDQTAAK